jgi:hypothetical protein
VSIEDQDTILALLHILGEAIRFDEQNEVFAETQEVLRRVAQDSQPIRTVQMLCKHPQQIIDLQRQITDLQARQYLRLKFNHTEMHNQVQTQRD